jgi:hypothetical protein
MSTIDLGKARGVYMSSLDFEIVVLHLQLVSSIDLRQTGSIYITSLNLEVILLHLQ